MRLPFAVILLSTALWCACGNDRPRTPVSPTPTPTPTTPVSPVPGIVRGTVLDFQTARPIAGAVVAFAENVGIGNSFIGLSETAVSDGQGRYALPEPPVRNSPYIFVVDNAFRGMGYPRAADYRADVAVDKGSCIARYGMVLDSKTYAPVVGATARNLSNQVRATSGQDGWYHIDWGCGLASIGFNTTWHVMSHPDYESRNFASGRGISGNLREDVLMTRR